MSENNLVEEFKARYKELGFEKIIRIQAEFPDCLAIKDGKIVAIEFEANSNGLVSHYVRAQYSSVDYYITEEPDYYTIIYQPTEYCWECGLKKPIKHKCPIGKPQVFARYPKKWFKIINAYKNGYFEICYRKLPIEYCVCFYHGAKNRAKNDEEMQGITFIEMNGENL